MQGMDTKVDGFGGWVAGARPVPDSRVRLKDLQVVFKGSLDVVKAVTWRAGGQCRLL